MKVAISSMDKTMDGSVSDVFGRCAYFIIVDVNEGHYALSEVIENKSINQRGGAGVSAGNAVTQAGATAVISANVGPRALDVLTQFDVKVYKGSGSIKDAMNNFVEKKLERITR